MPMEGGVPRINSTPEGIATVTTPCDGKTSFWIMYTSSGMHPVNASTSAWQAATPTSPARPLGASPVSMLYFGKLKVLDHTHSSENADSGMRNGSHPCTPGFYLAWCGQVGMGDSFSIVEYSRCGKRHRDAGGFSGESTRNLALSRRRWASIRCLRVYC